MILLRIFLALPDIHVFHVVFDEIARFRERRFSALIDLHEHDVFVHSRGPEVDLLGHEELLAQRKKVSIGWILFGVYGNRSVNVKRPGKNSEHLLQII